MISRPVRAVLDDAVNRPNLYKKGARKKILQANYETMLDELSRALFSEPCLGRMNMRIKLNSVDDKSFSQSQGNLINLLKILSDNEELLYSKTYADHSTEISRFCKKYLLPVLETV